MFSVYRNINKMLIKNSKWHFFPVCEDDHLKDQWQWLTQINWEWNEKRKLFFQTFAHSLACCAICPREASICRRMVRQWYNLIFREYFLLFWTFIVRVIISSKMASYNSLSGKVNDDGEGSGEWSSKYFDKISAWNFFRMGKAQIFVW